MNTCLQHCKTGDVIVTADGRCWTVLSQGITSISREVYVIGANDRNRLAFYKSDIGSLVRKIIKAK